MRDAIKTLFGRQAEPGDTADVAGAAGLLEVPEFRLFEIAYARWYGREAPEREVESHFGRYLRTRNAPIWVRHLARQVAGRYRAGRLDPRDFGLDGAISGGADAGEPVLRVIGEAVVAAPVIALLYALLHAI